MVSGSAGGGTGWVLLCLSPLRVEEWVPLPLCPGASVGGGWLCRRSDLVRFHRGMRWGWDAHRDVVLFPARSGCAVPGTLRGGPDRGRRMLQREPVWRQNTSELSLPRAQPGETRWGAGDER